MFVGNKITFSSIAREIGVTPSVVSRVMRNTSTTITIGKETKRRILDLAWSRGFQLNRNVGLIAPDKKDIGLIYHPAATGVLERCAELGFGIFNALYGEDGASTAIPEFLLKRKVGGVISFDLLPEKMLEYLDDEMIPYVVMNPRKYITDEDSILFSDYETMKELLSHLKGKGYRRYVYVSYDDKTHYSKMVKQSLEDFLKTEPFEGQILLTETKNEPKTIATLEGLVESSSSETVFITPTRLFTIKILEFFAMQGKHAPKDAGIVGSNLIADHYIPKLTTVNYPFYEMGMLAVDMLGEKWEKRIFKMPNRCICGRISINESTQA